MATGLLKRRNYILLNDNGWIVKKYDDGTYEAWYAQTNGQATTTTNVNGWPATDNLTITFPSIHKYHYYAVAYASFSSRYSFAISWVAGFNINYKILADSQITTAQTYRLSAYSVGSWI